MNLQARIWWYFDMSVISEWKDIRHCPPWQDVKWLCPCLFPHTLHLHLCCWCNRSVCFFVHCCCSSCLSHHTLDRSPDSGFLWAPEFTRGCGVSLRLLALHWGNTVIALRDHSCHLGPDLNWLQSEGAEAAVRLNHESAATFLCSPQSLNQQNLCSVKTFIPFGSEQNQRGPGVKPGGSMWASLTQHLERTTTIICDLYKFQKWISFELRQLWDVKKCALNLFPCSFSKSFLHSFLFSHPGVQKTASTSQQTTTDHAVSEDSKVTHTYEIKQNILITPLSLY